MIIVRLLDKILEGNTFVLFLASLWIYKIHPVIVHREGYKILTLNLNYMTIITFKLVCCNWLVTSLTTENPLLRYLMADGKLHLFTICLLITNTQSKVTDLKIVTMSTSCCSLSVAGV